MDKETNTSTQSDPSTYPLTPRRVSVPVPVPVLVRAGVLRGCSYRHARRVWASTCELETGSCAIATIKMMLATAMEMGRGMGAKWTVGLRHGC